MPFRQKNQRLFAVGLPWWNIKLNCRHGFNASYPLGPLTEGVWTTHSPHPCDVGPWLEVGTMPSRILDLCDGSWRETHRHTLLTSQGAWPLLVGQSIHMHIRIYMYVFIYIYLCIYIYIHICFYRVSMYRICIDSIHSLSLYKVVLDIIHSLFYFSTSCDSTKIPQFFSTLCKLGASKIHRGMVIAGKKVMSFVVRSWPLEQKWGEELLTELRKGHAVAVFGWLVSMGGRVLGESLQAKRAWKEYGGKGVQITKYH